MFHLLQKTDLSLLGKASTELGIGYFSTTDTPHNFLVLLFFIGDKY